MKMERSEMDVFLSRTIFMDMTNPYASVGQRDFAIFAVENERITFLQRTYVHLALCIVALIAVLAILLRTFPDEKVAATAARLGEVAWLAILVCYIGASWLARISVTHARSPIVQYLVLAVYVAATAVLLWPVLAFASTVDGSIPLNSCVVTLALFGALTMHSFSSRAVNTVGTTSLMLMIALIAAVGLGSWHGHFGLGLWLSVGVILLSALYVMYETSSIVYQYRTDQHIAAALTLFASTSLILWYVVRLGISLSRD